MRYRIDGIVRTENSSKWMHGVLFCLVVWFSQYSAYGQNADKMQQGKDLVDRFVLRSQESIRNYSVLVDEYRASENNSRRSVDFDKVHAPTPVAWTKISRFARKGEKHRIDARLMKHSERTLLHFLKMPGFEEAIERYGSKLETGQKPLLLYEVDPATLWVSDLGDAELIDMVSIDKTFKKVWLKLRTDKETTRMCCVTLNFNQFDEEWLPTRVTWSYEPSSGRGQNIKEWPFSSWTITDWEKTESGKFVPIKILTGEFPTNQFEKDVFIRGEIKFHDWKFDDDVSDELFDTTKFNALELEKSIDFDRWQKEILEASRGKNKNGN